MKQGHPACVAYFEFVCQSFVSFETSYVFNAFMSILLIILFTNYCDCNFWIKSLFLQEFLGCCRTRKEISIFFCFSSGIMLNKYRSDPDTPAIFWINSIFIFYNLFILETILMPSSRVVRSLPKICCIFVISGCLRVISPSSKAGRWIILDFDLQILII